MNLPFYWLLNGHMFPLFIILVLIVLNIRHYFFSGLIYDMFIGPFGKIIGKIRGMIQRRTENRNS